MFLIFWLAYIHGISLMDNPFNRPITGLRCWSLDSNHDAERLLDLALHRIKNGCTPIFGRMFDGKS